mmetsp:Transcript_5435/g.11837  ORF Transcript_5435/g.11837 Transcript_5435/m.11837 type:complete len:618 (-) Transcript_5435:645-2498(-)
MPSRLSNAMLFLIRLPTLAVLLKALLYHKSTSAVSAHDAAPPSSSSRRPNIILFMTDDQDVTANSLDYMPRLNRLFRREGMEFLHYYVPTGLCCPSRATILKGQYCHNTEIFDNGDLTNSTYQSGAWHKYLDTGLENETIATMLQSAGYETALIGKYLNGYMGPKAASHKPPGFDHWMGMLHLSFYGPSFSDNGEFLQLNETVYQTDFIRDWAVDFLTHKRDPSKPFFLMMTPFAPHTPATPAKRHEDMFQDAAFPRYDSFNPSDEVQQHRPAWIKDLPLLTQKQIDDMDNFYRNRLRSLQAIDEALEKVVDTLHDLQIDDNTYMFYTSDNGQHFGSFRIPAGKRQAYESDVLVPFLVRGPGIQHGAQVKQVVQSVDLAPTFLDLATRPSRYEVTSSYPMDGKSMLPLLRGEVPLEPAINTYRWAALLEMYGGSSNIGPLYKNMSAYYHNHMFPNTYQAARIVNGPGWAKGADLLYVEWCTGEQELYNMTVDRHQVDNIVGRTNLILLYRMSRLLARLGDCKGFGCYDLDMFSASKEAVAPGRELMTLDAMKASIRNRIPCHNPPNMTSGDTSLGRKQFAVGLHVPEPFAFGFPYSDGDAVSDELMEVWRKYEHYFY